MQVQVPSCRAPVSVWPQGPTLSLRSTSKRARTFQRSAGRDESSSADVVETQSNADVPASSSSSQEAEQRVRKESSRRAPSEALASTDWVASSLTRRFGIAGGLAWLGILTFGVVSEQVKTRLEVASEASNTREVQGSKEVALPSGVRYTDLRIGGGMTPVSGYLAVLHYKGYANGELFEDTYERGKPIVFLFGSRPFTAGLNPGVEEALSTMKAGGKRRVTVPPALGFGDEGAVLRPTGHVPGKDGVVPPGATLEYELELVRVSIPPS